MRCCGHTHTPRSTARPPHLASSGSPLRKRGGEWTCDALTWDTRAWTSVARLGSACWARVCGCTPHGHSYPLHSITAGPAVSRVKRVPRHAACTRQRWCEACRVRQSRQRRRVRRAAAATRVQPHAVRRARITTPRATAGPTAGAAAHETIIVGVVHRPRVAELVRRARSRPRPARWCKHPRDQRARRPRQSHTGRQSRHPPHATRLVPTTHTVVQEGCVSCPGAHCTSDR